jgi:hypothetical protein
MHDLPEGVRDMAARLAAFHERADTEGMSDMRRHLEMRKVAFGGDNKLVEFMLNHGRDYKVGPNTFAGPRGKTGMCYMNATLLAHNNPEMTYVEGYVATHGVPIEHAWCVDKDGFVVETTIDGSKGHVSEYYGVPFNTRYLRKATVTNDVYGLLGYPYSALTMMPLLEMGLEAGTKWLLDYPGRPKKPRKARRKKKVK